MSIRTACPRCGKVIDVPEHFAGKSGRCKACGAELTIPGGPKWLAPSPRVVRPRRLAPPDALSAEDDLPVLPIVPAVEVVADSVPALARPRRRLRSPAPWIAVAMGLVLVAVTVASFVVAGAGRGAAGGPPGIPAVADKAHAAPDPAPALAVAVAADGGVAAAPEVAEVQPPPAVAPNPPPAPAPARRVARPYLSPASGPESVLRMSTQGLDDGQREVVERFRRLSPDPERTSFVELWPTGTSSEPGTIVNRKHAVYAIVRAPNEYGAMTIERALFYYDDEMNMTGMEEPLTMRADPWLYPILRLYYGPISKTDEEQRAEAMMKSVRDMADHPPIPAPQQRKRR